MKLWPCTGHRYLCWPNLDAAAFFFLSLRYELVPKKVKEDEFWRNYFYRVGLAKQSFELAPVAPITSTTTAKPSNSTTSANRQKFMNIYLVSCSLWDYNRAMDDVEDGVGDQEDEFLSEQQEVIL